jgi:hypothetical protein
VAIAANNHITLEAALPQLSTDLQRRVARHLAERPGFSSTDRLLSELFGGPRPDLVALEPLRRDATKRQLSSALRRLQAIGFVRYDAEFGGWVR